MKTIGNSFVHPRKKCWRFLAEIFRSERCKVCKSCRSRQELSKEYLLAKIGVDTAENEPLKVWGKFNLIFIRLLGRDSPGVPVSRVPGYRRVQRGYGAMPRRNCSKSAASIVFGDGPEEIVSGCTDLRLGNFEWSARNQEAVVGVLIFHRTVTLRRGASEPHFLFLKNAI